MENRRREVGEGSNFEDMGTSGICDGCWVGGCVAGRRGVGVECVREEVGGTFCFCWRLVIRVGGWGMGAAVVLYLVWVLVEGSGN